MCIDARGLASDPWPWLNDHMAQHVVSRITCDLDEEEELDAVETVAFAYNGRDYVLDLCPDHLDGFRQVKNVWTSAARAVKR